MLNSRTFKDGILSGTVVTPDSTEAVDIRFVGSPLDLMKVAMFLGLEPVQSQIDDLLEDRDPGQIILTDNRGGMATLCPTERASDLIQSIAAFAQENGFEPPPFL
jgi:hypothetical protein